MTLKERQYEPDHDKEIVVVDWSTYGGLKFPTFLITKESYETRMSKYQSLLKENAESLSGGVDTSDAGDAHGMFHNELAWRKEQAVYGTAIRAKDIGGDLHKSLQVPDLSVLRKELEKLKVKPQEKVTLTSVVTIQFGNNKDDVESYHIVAPLDEGTYPNWISINAPIALAIEGKKNGDEASVNAETLVKIVDLK